MTFAAKLKLLIARADDGDREAIDEYQVLVTSNADNLVALVEAAQMVVSETRYLTGLPNSDPEKGGGNYLADALTALNKDT